MKLQEKISLGNNAFEYPDDLLDFLSNPVFGKEKNVIIEECTHNIVDIDYYTNSVEIDNSDFNKPFEFLKLIINKYQFTELIIKQFDENLKPGLLATLPIQKVIVDKNAQKIPDCIFKDMKNLKEVVLMDGIESIGDEVFMGCRSLKCISIPSSIVKIGSNICGNCIFLESIEVDKENKWYGSFGCDVIARKNDMEIIQGCYKSSFNADFRSIGFRAFWKMPLLKEIMLPSSLETISDEAFLGCVGLRKIDLPNSLRTISKAAFTYVNPEEVSFNGSVSDYSSISGNNLFKLVKCTDGEMVFEK